MKQIVKNLVSVLMMMAMAIVCTTSFTSCGGDDDAVSYTHLTLPTNREV